MLGDALREFLHRLRRSPGLRGEIHVMQHAERLCDRILLIPKGRKILDGTAGLWCVNA